MIVLVVAFLGWLCSGAHMSITQLAGQPAALDLLDRVGSLDRKQYQLLNERAASQKTTGQAAPGGALNDSERQQLDHGKTVIAQWFAWFQCAFLFGAASGGLIFGALGDRIGRSKAMALSILMYSSMAGACSFAQAPWQLLVLWFLACTGTGGMWPNGVSLVAEAWSDWSRPLVSGVIGTAANIGLFLMSTLAAKKAVTPDDWRWMMVVGATPIVLGLFALFAVPESPRWLALRDTKRLQGRSSTDRSSTSEVFRPPLLGITLIGILLATIPLLGGWGSANWMIPWAADASESAAVPDPFLKAQVAQARAVTGIFGSFVGGWMASLVGRRRSYFLISLGALAISQYMFWCLVPTDPQFLAWVAILGFVSGLYFGWLPLFLPELFPTRVRSTGAGVSFNFGRIATAITIFATGALTQVFGGDYARIGQVTSLIFVVGLVVIWFAPDTTKSQVAD